MADDGERAKGGEKGRRESPLVILAELGVTAAMQSSRWRRLAGLTVEAFEKAMAAIADHHCRLLLVKLVAAMFGIAARYSKPPMPS
jgi:hypothetical protein